MLEAGVAVATWGASVGFTMAGRGIQLSTRALRIAKRLEGAERLADASNFARRLRGAQDFSARVTGYLPSSWGSTLVEGGAKRAFGSQRAGAGFWDSVIGRSSMQSRAIDFAEGLVEGAMYSTINQVSHSENGWDWEAFWNETLSEGGGQVVAGPIFRGVFRTGSYGVHMVSQGTLNRIYNGLNITDETRAAMAAAFQPVDEKWNTLTQEQKNQVMQAKILMGMAYTNWNEITGSTEGMSIVTQSVLAELGRAVENELDIAGLVATVHKNRPVDPETGEQVELTPLEATIATVDAALQYIDQNTDKALSAEQEEDLFRTIVLGAFAENQIRETGDSLTDQKSWDKQLDALAQMDPEERTAVIEEAAKAWESVSKKLGLRTVRLRPDSSKKKSVEFETISNDAAQTLIEMFPSMEFKDIPGLDPESIAALEKISGDRDRTTDSLDVENAGEVVKSETKSPDDPMFDITTQPVDSDALTPDLVLPVNLRGDRPTNPNPKNKPFEAESAVDAVEEKPGSPAVETVIMAAQ